MLAAPTLLAEEAHGITAVGPRLRKHLAYDTRVVADVALPYLDLCVRHLRVRPKASALNAHLRARVSVCLCVCLLCPSLCASLCAGERESERARVCVGVCVCVNVCVRMRLRAHCLPLIRPTAVHTSAVRTGRL